MKQIPLPILAEATQSFESFVPGANEAAVQHLRSLEASAAPVYLWGPSGSGKTHLLQALALQRRDLGLRVGWFSAATPPPWPVDEGWSLVLLYYCDAFDAARQQAAFTVFVEAGGSGVQVAAAGRLPPVDLPVRDDLRTRLGWGHVFAIQPLQEAEARAALRREADRRGIFLSDDVMDYLLTRFQRDLKHLMQLLERLDRFALSQQRAVTVPLLKAMLAEEGS
ncbi:MAG TPA: DnaA regulatory inactivator Hda [Burkholderiaceae bacterium]|nr:DnaA regulatory inactivator Hda [Burkholderiaceae bacterium]